MTAAAHESALPNEELAEQSAEVLSFLEAHGSRHGKKPEPTYFLCGADEHERVELTEGIYEMFKDLLSALADRKSVQILALDQEVTTQQAAELLGLSRPTVVKLIKSGEIPAHVPGVNRRKLRLADVLAYKDLLYKQRNEFIAESSAAYEGDEDLVDVDDLLNEARKNR